MYGSRSENRKRCVPIRNSPGVRGSRMGLFTNLSKFYLFPDLLPAVPISLDMNIRTSHTTKFSSSFFCKQIFNVEVLNREDWFTTRCVLDLYNT